jgi:hypothetical protein
VQKRKCGFAWLAQKADAQICVSDLKLASVRGGCRAGSAAVGTAWIAARCLVIVSLGGELSMAVRNDAWRASGAYLYVLRLDGPSLAWEYLRRNPDYRRDWAQYAHDKDRIAKRWQLAMLEDPAMDARIIQPTWRPEPDLLVQLTADTGHDAADAPRFSLWAIAGRKSLAHDGRRLVLFVFAAGRVLRIAIAASLSDGDAFAYVVPAGARIQDRWHAVEASRAVLEGRPFPGTSAVPIRPDRVALAHMRSLQALDGVLAGASQREIAAVVFGSSRVRKSWCADGDLRAQTRHLIRRGRAFMNGGYARLVTGIARRNPRTMVGGGR